MTGTHGNKIGSPRESHGVDKVARRCYFYDGVAMYTISLEEDYTRPLPAVLKLLYKKGRVAHGPILYNYIKLCKRYNDIVARLRLLTNPKIITIPYTCIVAKELCCNFRSVLHRAIDYGSAGPFGPSTTEYLL